MADQKSGRTSALQRLRKAVQFHAAAAVEVGALIAFSDFELTADEHAGLKLIDRQIGMAVDRLGAFEDRLVESIENATPDVGLVRP